MVFQADPLGVGEVGSVDLSHARERTKPSQLSTLQNRLLEPTFQTGARAVMVLSWAGASPPGPSGTMRSSREAPAAGGDNASEENNALARLSPKSVSKRVYADA